MNKSIFAAVNDFLKVSIFCVDYKKRRGGSLSSHIMIWEHGDRLTGYSVYTEEK